MLKRQEFKYFIYNKDIDFLRYHLKKYMKLDSNSNQETSSYKISTLYFDSITQECLNEKLDGINSREKFRIRKYNDDNSLYKLECKQKIDTAIYKKAVIVNESEVTQLIKCNYSFMLNSKDPFLKEIYFKFTNKKFSPAILLSYDREAYTLPYNNIRITIDKNLRTHNSDINIINTKKNTLTIFDPGLQILEVKYSNHLPEHIRHILSMINASRSAISKYVYACKFVDTSRWRDTIFPPY